MRRGRRVYYRKVRCWDEVADRSRVRSIYFGSGERAEAAAREDEERRAACATAVTEIRHIKKREPVEVGEPGRMPAKVGAGGASPITRSEIAERAGLRSGSSMLADYFAGCGLVARALEMAGISDIEAERRGLAL